MEFQEVMDLAKAQALKDVEALFKNQVNVVFEPAANAALEKLKAIIPGNIDDSIINTFAPQLVELLKQELLAQVEKVSA